jgi:AraC-like DNA-binding protein
MADVARLTGALKKHLKARGMTYAALARRLHLSEASVKRVFATGSFTLQRLGQVCEVLDLDFYDLAKLAHNKAALATRMTREQEEALAADRKLLLTFHLLLNDWDAGEIAANYKLSGKEILQRMRDLHRLRLIELGPKNEVRLRTGRNIDWAHDGPMRKAYQKQLVSEFFASAFDARHQALRFDGKELSASSIAVLVRKIDRLIRDFEELAEIDAPLRREDKHSVVLISAVRPYVLSSFAELKRNAAAPGWPAAPARAPSNG